VCSVGCGGVGVWDGCVGREGKGKDEDGMGVWV